MKKNPNEAIEGFGMIRMNFDKAGISIPVFLLR